MAGRPLLKKDIIYPQLSYQIIGVLFSVFNALGYGYKEKYYQRAVAKELNFVGLNFKEQVNVPIIYHNQIIGRQIYDFLIDNKIILEIKRGDRFSKNDITQVTGYLKTAELQLAILARFSSKGLIFKRIVNIV